jgi:uncharacterized protein YecE (DUF72 family)
MIPTIRVGTAGWAIPAPVATEFPGDGSVLARYASVLNAVEINSTFYRSHQPKTFERWAATVPATFRFAVKTPRAVTHTARLHDCTGMVEAFLGQISHLGPALGPLLLQLPPSFAFDSRTVEPFCRVLSQDDRLRIACEPRHVSWFTPEVDRWLAERRIARVAADPARHPGAGEPGGWRGLSYYRMHGSPKMYYSAYSPGDLTGLQDRCAQDSADETWCIFDNTASGAALPDALALHRRIHP